MENVQPSEGQECSMGSVPRKCKRWWSECLLGGSSRGVQLPRPRKRSSSRSSSIREGCSLHLSMQLQEGHTELCERKGAPAQPARSARSILLFSGMTDVTARSPSHLRMVVFTLLRKCASGRSQNALKSMMFLYYFCQWGAFEDF